MMKRFYEMGRHRRDDIIKMEGNRVANIRQVLLDWNRGKQTIFIDGVSLEQICRDEGYTKLNDKNEIVVRDMTSEELEYVWKKYLLKNISETVHRKMLDHMAQYMHQGGYLNMLHASLNAMGIDEGKKQQQKEGEQESQEPQKKMGFCIKDSDSKRRLDFSVKEGEILMTDRLEVSALTGASLGMDADTGDLVRGNPVMVATGRYILGFNKKAIPQCTVDGVTLVHHSDYTRSKFDQRSIFEQIKGFVNNIYEAVKESFAKKKEDSKHEKESQDRSYP